MQTPLKLNPNKKCEINVRCLVISEEFAMKNLSSMKKTSVTLGVYKWIPEGAWAEVYDPEDEDVTYMCTPIVLSILIEEKKLSELASILYPQNFMHALSALDEVIEKLTKCDVKRNFSIDRIKQIKTELLLLSSSPEISDGLYGTEKKQVLEHVLKDGIILELLPYFQDCDYRYSANQKSMILRSLIYQLNLLKSEDDILNFYHKHANGNYLCQHRHTRLQTVRTLFFSSPNRLNTNSKNKFIAAVSEKLCQVSHRKSYVIDEFDTSLSMKGNNKEPTQFEDVKITGKYTPSAPGL